MAVGYLTSRYPAVSHTFIRREVQALRAAGVKIQTFSLRRTPDDQVLSKEDGHERDGTWSILPISALKALQAQLAGLTSSPGAYLQTLREANRHRIPGARAALWGVFHFAEAIVLARELRRRGVTHLHSHFSNAGGDVGYLAAMYLGIPWSVTLHGSADFDSPTRGLLREKIARADRVACVTHFGRALASRLSNPAHWNKLEIVRCGVDLAKVRAQAAQKAEGPVRVISVGRLAPEKGQIGLLKAVAGLSRKGHDVVLRIIGEGPERGALEAMASSLGIAGKLELPGHASEVEVWREISQADIFAMSSFMEGLPVVIMEAMALGVPVVAPRLAGIPELVEDNASGLLFHPADWEGLEAALQRLVGSESERTRLAAEGTVRIEREFDITAAVLPLLRYFQPKSTADA